MSLLSKNGKSNKFKKTSFFTMLFIILSILFITSILFIVLFLIGFRIYVSWDDMVCDNINDSLIAISTSYIVSYIIYVVTFHIPNYKQKKENEKIMKNVLDDYRYHLIKCFSMFVILYDNQCFDKIKNIEEIRDFIARTSDDKTKEYIIKKSYEILGKETLIDDFKKLGNTFEKMYAYANTHVCNVTSIINEIYFDDWNAILNIIISDLNCNLNDFKIYSQDYIIEKIKGYFRLIRYF